MDLEFLLKYSVLTESERRHTPGFSSSFLLFCYLYKGISTTKEKQVKKYTERDILKTLTEMYICFQYTYTAGQGVLSTVFGEPSLEYTKKVTSKNMFVQ